MVDQEQADVEVEEAPQVGAEQLALLGVEPGRRLVEQEQLRLRRECSGDADQLALAVAEFARMDVGEVGQLHRLERLVDLLGGGVATAAGPDDVGQERVPPRAIGGDQQVVANGEVLEQLERLERPDQPELGPRVGAQAGEVGPVEGDVALGDRREAGDGVDEGGLAGTVGADQADQLAGLAGEVDVVVRVESAVGDREAFGFEQ